MGPDSLLNKVRSGWYKTQDGPDRFGYAKKLSGPKYTYYYNVPLKLSLDGASTMAHFLMAFLWYVMVFLWYFVVFCGIFINLQ